MVSGTALSVLAVSSHIQNPLLWRRTADARTSRLRLSNGTQTPQQCPSRPDAGAPKLSIANCGAEGGPTDWRLVPAPGSQGAPLGSLQLQQGGDSGVCAWASTSEYHNSGGLVTAGLCSTQRSAWWTWDAATGLLQFNATQCLVAVPPNLNVTIALAMSLFSADGSAVPLVGQSATASAATATVSLTRDTDYMLIVAAPTNRDLDWADPLEGAVEMLGRYANTAGVDYAASRRASHAAFWSGYWSA